MEPFSTSVYMVLTYIIATTTKICTISWSTPGHPVRFYPTDTPSYSQTLLPARVQGTHALRLWLSIGVRLERH